MSYEVAEGDQDWCEDPECDGPRTITGFHEEDAGTPDLPRPVQVLDLNCGHEIIIRLISKEK